MDDSAWRRLVTFGPTQIRLGALRAANRFLQLVSLARDISCAFDLRLWSDSSASMGISKRRGCGKVPHLETPTLWVQKAIKDKKFVVHKVPGTLNMSDTCTNHVDRGTLMKLLDRMGIRLPSGKHATV